MVNLNYYTDAGIIDFWGLTFDKNELAQRIYSEFESGKEAIENLIQELTEFENDAITAINIIEKEKPYKIRYFAIPNFNSCDFNFCCLAKIQNNGTTYLFAEDKNTIHYLTREEKRDRDILLLQK